MLKGLNTFPDVVKIKIIDGVIPKVNPPLRVLVAIKSRLEQSLKKLVNKQIMEPVNDSQQRVGNIVVVEKPNGSLRICIDPSEKRITTIIRELLIN